jgi:hypothetical protein
VTKRVHLGNVFFYISKVYLNKNNWLGERYGVSREVFVRKISQGCQNFNRQSLSGEELICETRK